MVDFKGKKIDVDDLVVVVKYSSSGGSQSLTEGKVLELKKSFGRDLCYIEGMRKGVTSQNVYKI